MSYIESVQICLINDKYCKKDYLMGEIKGSAVCCHGRWDQNKHGFGDRVPIQI